MDRKHFIRLMAFTPLIGVAQKMQVLNNLADHLPSSDLMPVLFVGHGSPMNAIEDNIFSKEMKAMGAKLPKPKAILMVSAHWETLGTFVTSQDLPPTIHDFGGFPQALFDVQYQAPGSAWLAAETQKAIRSTSVALNDQWGFDHGCWSVTKNMFPNSDIPIIQLSLDYRQGPQYHYDLAKQLVTLRKKGVLIIGSGNMVHSFKHAVIKGGDFNAPLGHDWALEANETFKKLISLNDYKSLINYKTYSKALDLAAPTPEHYLPLLYTIALRDPNDPVSFFNDMVVGGSFSMTSLKIGL